MSTEQVTKQGRLRQQRQENWTRRHLGERKLPNAMEEVCRVFAQKSQRTTAVTLSSDGG